MKPGKFAKPPTTLNPTTGELELNGRDALPWAIDTLDLGGEIRDKFIRLQNWVRTVYLGEPVEPEPSDRVGKLPPTKPARRKRFGIF